MTAPRTSLAATALALTVAALSPVTVTAPAQAAETDRILTTRWSSDAQLKAGTRRGLDVANGALRIADRPAGTTKVSDPYTSAGKRDYEYGRWASPWVSTGFAARALIPSWNAVARKRTFLRIHLRTSNGSTVSSWDKVAEWGMKTEGVHRHSGPAQADDLNQLLTDTLVSNGGSTMQRWQLRITLLRPVGASGSLPRVHSVGGVASSFRTRSQTVSPTTMTAARELSVPRASQMEHSGHFPQWGNGGQAWCSPTSMSMVLRYWGRGPRPRDYAWAHAEGGEVDYAARYTYDHAYRGTGNWPFNTAYASNYGLDAFVTRLRNLRDAEAFIKAGIPVVTSLAFGRGELTGSPISSTNGHLMVVIGFTADGRVIVNDPAASSESGVRRVYQRGQFERAWLGGSGGVTYVVRPADRALPKDTTRW